MSEAESRHTDRRSRLSDRLNPILVLELRRMFHSRAFEMMLLIFLGAAVAVMGFGLIEARRQGPDAELGREVFAWLLGLLLFTGLAVVPLHAGVRLFLDRGTDRLNLIAITGLTFHQIFWGRFLAALVIPLLLLTTLAPLALLCLLLRGIDWSSILIALVIAIIFVESALMLTLCAAGMVQGVASRIVGILLTLGMLLIHALVVTFLTMKVVMEGAGALLHAGIICPVIGLAVFGVTLLAGLYGIAAGGLGRDPAGVHSTRISLLPLPDRDHATTSARSHALDPE